MILKQLKVTFNHREFDIVTVIFDDTTNWDLQQITIKLGTHNNFGLEWNVRNSCNVSLYSVHLHFGRFDFCILYLCYISFCICAAGKERYFSGIVLKWKLPFCLVHTVARRQFHFYNTRQQCCQNTMDSFSIVFLSFLFFLQLKTAMLLIKLPNMFLVSSSSSTNCNLSC